MTDPKEKQKPVVNKREPKKIKSTGLFDNLRPLPHPIEEIMGFNIPLSPSDGQSPSVHQTTPPIPVAPERDFNRRANSLERDALPSGLFPGSSKKLYDALYLRTRGAINPCRTIRATKKDLADWSGIRNRKTIDGHLRYLATCGLLERRWELGNVEGYLFEVRLPEETPLVDRGGQRGDSPSDHSDQKRDRGTDQKRDTDGQSQIAVESITSATPKTFIKTDEKNDDDEPFGGFATAFQTATKDLTGKQLTRSDKEKLNELADLLVMELKIAAGRTTVSSVPAFLTEHLRRRLWKKDKQQLREEGKAEPTPSLTTEEMRSCPDCNGTGFYYPNGYDQGVSRCQHQQLKAE